MKVRISFPPGRVLRDDGRLLALARLQGDGDPDTIDLVVEIEGDGLTRGFAGDAFKVKSTVDPPGGIQVTGFLNCGPPPRASHQDGIQLQGGDGIGFYDVEIGDWEAGTATCSGAGGALLHLGHALDLGQGHHRRADARASPATTGSGSTTTRPRRGRWRTPASGPATRPTREAGQCEFQAGACADFARAPQWTFTDVVCDDWPYGKGER